MTTTRRPKPNVEFENLKAHWYSRLRADGFDDAESDIPNSPEPQLKVWHSCYFQLRHDPASFEAKAAYYQQAQHYLSTGHFHSQTDRHVWKLHSEGRGVRQIAKILSRKGHSLKKDRVASIVRSVKDQMRGNSLEKKEVIPQWTQMNLFDEIS